jgi:eukaryotic-like serine/threonine-protein kinase
MELATRRESTLTTGSMVSAYQIERTIGSGGMGSVFCARHVLDGHIAALKVLREDQLRQSRAIDRMMREAAVLASVQHPGIPRFFECGTLPDNRPWIAMELVDGQPLSRVLVAGAKLSHEVVIELVSQIADVLAAAHARGITHRDLKPENVLLTPDDTRYPLRVIDWGIAIHQSTPRFTNHDEAIGTPTYMAPEQARGGPATSRTDVYGLGIVAYQALAGRAPFVADNPIEILVQHLSSPVPELARRCPDAPVGLCELIEQMLAKRGDDRPTAAQVRHTLRELRRASDKRTTAPQDAVPEPVDHGNETPATIVVKGVRRKEP